MFPGEASPLAELLRGTLRAAESIFGGVRAAARELGLARSTFDDIILGRVTEPSAGTFGKVGEWLAGLDKFERWDVFNLRDEFLTGTEQEWQLLRGEYLADPDLLQERIGELRWEYGQEAERREEAGEPPMFVSP